MRLSAASYLRILWALQRVCYIVARQVSEHELAARHGRRRESDREDRTVNLIVAPYYVDRTEIDGDLYEF